MRLPIITLLLFLFSKIAIALDKTIYQESLDLFNKVKTYEENESYEEVGKPLYQSSIRRAKSNKTNGFIDWGIALLGTFYLL